MIGKILWKIYYFRVDIGLNMLGRMRKILLRGMSDSCRFL